MNRADVVYNFWFFKIISWVPKSTVYLVLRNKKAIHNPHTAIETTEVLREDFLNLEIQIFRISLSVISSVRWHRLKGGDFDICLFIPEAPTVVRVFVFFK
jgi:hypothetical protein